MPREVLPGRTYMITRRCTQRQFLMRPDRETNNAFVYCLGEAAARFQVDVLFTIANSNHHHTGIYDRRGNYPAFIERFHKLFAKCQNALRGRWENFWASEQTSVVRLVDADDILAKMVYALTNPVKDFIVEKAHHWPGASAVEAVLQDKPLSATRPQHFFREEGQMPQFVTLKFARPPGFEHLPHGEFAAMLEERIRHTEKEAASQLVGSRGRILGRAAALKQDWRARPASREPRRELSPRVAARNKWSRIEALLRNKAFQNAYAAARAALVDGLRDVLFPPGTYWLPRFTAIRCSVPGTA